MADKKQNINEPELLAKEDSEIEALVCLGAKGVDGFTRPIFINQCGEDLLALTLEDAIRLFWFLDKAIPYVKEYQDRTEQ